MFEIFVDLNPLHEDKGAVMFMTMIEQLGLDSTFFVMMGVFFIVFLINKFISLGPLSRTLVERDKRMAGREVQINKIQNEVKDIQEKLSAEMKIAQQEASKRFSELKASAVEKQRTLLQTARADAASQVGEARESLDSQKQKERQKLNTEVDTFAELIVERIAASSAPGFVSSEIRRTEA